MLLFSEVNPTAHFAFTAITVVILLFAIVFLCCDSSEPSNKHDEEGFLLVRHDSTPILFRTISAEDERDRTLRILSDRGELHPIAPPVDRRSKDQLINHTVSHSPNTETTQPQMNYGTQSFIEELPPPYSDAPLVVLDRNGQFMASSMEPSRYGDTHPDTLSQRPPPFAP